MDADSLPDIANLLSGAIGPSTRAATCTAIAACTAGAQAATLRHQIGTVPAGENIIRRLLLLCADPACSRLALSALVNISEDEDAALRVTNAGGAERCTQALLSEEQRGLWSLYGGLLSNLTRFGAGLDSLFGKGKGEMKEIRARGVLIGLMRRVERIPNILWVANVCMREEGRSILVGEDGSILSGLLRISGADDEGIRFTVASALRNCGIAEEVHEELVREGNIIAFCLGRLRTAPGGLMAESGGNGKGELIEPLEEVRVLLSEALLLLCKSRVGRDALRAGDGYDVLDKLRNTEESPQVLQAVESVLDRIAALEDGQTVEAADMPDSISIVQTVQ